MAKAKALVDKMLGGDRLSLARLVSLIENRDSQSSEVVRLIYPKTGSAKIWGITGPPGAGKSTLVDQMITRLRAKSLRAAVVAVDPSSPFTGGAVLGDRIRMQKHCEDSGVFIRSLGTRGMHGGLSHATKEVVLLLDAAGFDVVLVETAGVGQTELEILKLAQTIGVVLVPESGDSIQVMKAGLMEIADVFSVNKSDRPEADQMVRELINMIGLSPLKGEKGWDVPVFKTEAVRGVGVNEFLEAFLGHHEFLKKSGKLVEREKDLLMNEVRDILMEKLSKDLEASFESASGKKRIQALLDRKKDPYTISEEFSSD